MTTRTERVVRRRLVSIERACEQLGLKRSRVTELVAAGDLVVIKVGGRTLVTTESLEELVRWQHKRATRDGRVRVPPKVAA